MNITKFEKITPFPPVGIGAFMDSRCFKNFFYFAISQGLYSIL